jgi:hypothetical protein
MYHPDSLTRPEPPGSFAYPDEFQKNRAAGIKFAVTSLIKKFYIARMESYAQQMGYIAVL